MALCTVDDIRKVLPDKQLNLLTGGDTTLIDSAIEQSESEVEAYVSVKYSWPLSPFPKLVGVLISKLAVCTLYRAHSVVPEIWQTTCKNVQSTLEKIAKGQISLAIDAGEDSPSAGFSAVSGTKRMAGPGGLLEKF